MQKSHQQLYTSSSISINSSISSDDAMKVAYHLPAMGGLTAGISHTDRSAAGGTDTTSYGAKYSMDAAGASITLGYAAHYKMRIQHKMLTWKTWVLKLYLVIFH